jgi:hypothetical protein
MRHYAWLLPVATCLLARASAAQEAAPGEPVVVETVVPRPVDEPLVFRDELVLDAGRLPDAKPDPDGINFSFHGEYQLRFRAASDLPMTPLIGRPADESAELGQRYSLHHWLRFRPRFLYKEAIAIVGEVDFPRGMIAGDTTQDVSAARDDLAEARWYEGTFRQLYLQYTMPIGLVRLGHQTSHWGMGLVANDGDHPSLFGDYRRGAIVERFLFATKPLGKDGPLTVALAGDIVADDARARLVEGDRAYQGVAVVRLGNDVGDIGVYGVVRHQERDDSAVNELTPFTESLTVGVVDLAGKLRVPIPSASAFAFADVEAAVIFGDTTMIRNIELTRAGETESVRSFGGAGRIGMVHVCQEDEEPFGDVVVSVEWGYASGDADPYDGVTKRFTIDQNHNVGLVLFDQVLAWKTARAATIAFDESIVNRVAPGVDLVPSEGGIFGAQYLNPTVVVRPRSWLDLKGGLVIAQTTADFVDPVGTTVTGSYVNYDRGDENGHDLGVELDAGSDARIHIGHYAVVHVGIEGGVLFPGNAFEDASGTRLSNQYLLNAKAGLDY